MIHPSYSELIKVVNENGDTDEPVVNSRYSIVIATAKRARQIIAGQESFLENAEGRKPLSVAVDELYSGDVKIVADSDALNQDEDYFADK